jgi:hypothetical protein
MLKTKLCLVVLVLLGFIGPQAWGAYLAAWWDGDFPTNWADEASTVAVRDALEENGYEILDSAELKDWMDARIADGTASVVVLCRDIAPDTVVEDNTADCTLRKYLDAGGRIVFYADIPFWNQGHTGGGTTNWGQSGATGIFGFSAAPNSGIAAWNSGNTVSITEEGLEWGLTETWTSQRPALPENVDIILATDDDGGAAAWVKYFADGEEGGFVRIRDTGGMPNIDDIMRVAEYGLGSNPLARGPKPKNGSMLEQTTVMLTWKPGDFADVHNVYFGDDADAVTAATPEDADIFAGTLSTEILVVGMGADTLVPGTTYYWRVDEVNDANAASPWKGNVWSFSIKPLIAYQPSPADGAINVLLDQDLTWEPGIGTIFHQVAFGTSFEEVRDIPVPAWMTVDPTYDPGPLEADTTYYWRADEFKGMTTDKGEVWSFTTVPVVAITDPDLVGWWTLDEGIGMTALDWSGHAHHGALVGGPQWTDGYHGGALELDGRDDYVDFGNPPDWPAGQSARSMCGWAKTDRVTAGWRWIAAYGSPATSQAMFIGINGTALYGGGYGDDVNLDGFWQAGVWHHICLTYDGTTARLYADGEEVASAAKTWDLALSRAHIGRQVNTAAEFWDGTVDDVRIYSKVLTPAEIAEIMRGNVLLAANPEPAQSATVDIRDATALRWSAGETAASHDVYFGTDRAAVAAADRGAAEYRGNQVGTSMSLAGLVEFGGGDYYWRIDEVEAGGATIHEGYIWKFTVPAYLIVDDFESYNNEVGSRPFEVWIDGVGFTLPAPGNPGNGSGALVGHDIWTDTSPYFNGLLMETQNVHGGFQSMPVDYGNDLSPFYSEIDRTWATPQNWTLHGVDTLTLHVSGAATNGADRFYVTLADSSGRSATVDVADTSVLTSRKWSVVSIPLADFTGVNAAAIKKMIVGLGNPPAAGGAGSLLFDDFRVTKGE